MHKINRNKIQVPLNKARGPGLSAAPQTAPSKPHVNKKGCRTSEYMPAGSKSVGLGPNNQPSKVVWELPYGLTEDQFGKLSKRFPGIAFVQTGLECHDHPIAHTSYRVVWDNIIRKLQPGQLVADIAGNPAYNETFNRSQVGRNQPIQIDTFCKVLTPKDSVRAKTRWGPKELNGKTRWEEMTLYDMYRNDCNVERFRKYDVFLMNQSLYYYTMGEVAKLLSMNKESVLIATIHRLPGREGFINCGEQRYEKDPLSGRVVQVNVETGEDYQHPDPAPWFRNFSYADSDAAMAWTINKGCDDTYIVTATSTDPKLVPERCWKDGRIVYRNDQEVVEVTVSEPVDPPPAYSREVVTIKTHDLLPGYATNKEKAIVITHPDLYTKLKVFMINKPRTSRTLTDLTAKAHREAGFNTLRGAGPRLDISPEALTEHIFAAWMSGVDVEAELFGAVYANNPRVSEVNRNVTGRTLVFGPGNATKQALRAAISFATVVKSREPVHAVLSQLDELL